MKINNTIMVVRSILASSLLITLFFNKATELFPKYHLDQIFFNNYTYSQYNLFVLFRENVLIASYISMLVMILVILGIYPRIIAFLHLYVSYSFFHASSVQEGGDQINLILCLLLIPICISNTKFFGWKFDASNLNVYYSEIWSAALFLIKVQMCYLYFEACVMKIPVVEWSNGTAVYYWFNSNVFGASGFIKELIASFTNTLTISLITWSVLILEFFLFIAFFLKQKYKYILFVFGVLFHLCIIIIHGLPTFFISMLAGLVLYLFNDNLTIKENLSVIKNLFSWKRNSAIKQNILK